MGGGSAAPEAGAPDAGRNPGGADPRTGPCARPRSRGWQAGVPGGGVRGQGDVDVGGEPVLRSSAAQASSPMRRTRSWGWEGGVLGDPVGGGVGRRRRRAARREGPNSGLAPRARRCAASRACSAGQKIRRCWPAHSAADSSRPAHPVADPERPPHLVADPSRPVHPVADPERPAHPAVDPLRPAHPAADPERPAHPVARLRQSGRGRRRRGRGRVVRGVLRPAGATGGGSRGRACVRSRCGRCRRDCRSAGRR